jgi:hypothetical protein
MSMAAVPSQHAVNEELNYGSLEFSTHSEQSRADHTNTPDRLRATTDDGISSPFYGKRLVIFQFSVMYIKCDIGMQIQNVIHFNSISDMVQVLCR